MVAIEFVDTLPPDLRKKMEQGLLQYETSHGIDVNYKAFSLILREGQEVVGILDAFMSYSAIHIVDIWVNGPQRGQGYGRKLIEALEQRFKGKGFNNINLVTCAFQAPGFYKKCGFQEEFVRVNHDNQKLTTTFFVKYLDD